jgi:pantetheine-phosphate adenylyltransferase
MRIGCRVSDMQWIYAPPVIKVASVRRIGFSVNRPFLRANMSSTTYPPAPAKRIAVFPGQFDPITNGHLDVIRRGVGLFDELIVAVGVNPEKKGMFSVSQRLAMIRPLLKEIPGTRLEKYAGLTMDFVKKAKATVILRGIRDISDLRYEFQLALANRTVGGIETVFIMTGDQYALTSSSLIRQVVSLGGDIRKLRGVLPETVLEKLASLKNRKGMAIEGPPE